jgi:hypothetical protein
MNIGASDVFLPSSKARKAPYIVLVQNKSNINNNKTKEQMRLAKIIFFSQHHMT